MASKEIEQARQIDQLLRENVLLVAALSNLNAQIHIQNNMVGAQLPWLQKWEDITEEALNKLASFR